MFNVKTATTAELIAEYNRLTGKNIKRFSTRKAGELQVERMLNKPNAVKAESAPAEHKNRSLAARESWGSSKVAKARSARDGVKVEGVAYRSVAAAFKELGLPMGKHIPFRAQVKRDGHATFVADGDRKYKFTIVAKEA